MKRVLDVLEEQIIGKDKHLNVLIQGGYFESHAGIDEFSINTLKKAKELGHHLTEKYRKIKITHGLLINDLGQSCSGEACSVSSLLSTAPATLEKQIKDLQKITGTTDINLVIATERHMKNVGLRKIKRLIKKSNHLSRSIYPLEDNHSKKWFLSSDASDDILLFEERGLNWIAKCPVIMGAYYHTMLKLIGTTNSISIVIDFCAANDKNKVLKGAETSHKVLGNCEKLEIIIPVISSSDCSYLYPIAVNPMEEI